LLPIALVGIFLSRIGVVLDGQFLIVRLASAHVAYSSATLKAFVSRNSPIGRGLLRFTRFYVTGQWWYYLRLAASHSHETVRKWSADSKRCANGKPPISKRSAWWSSRPTLSRNEGRSPALPSARHLPHG
jgi:hypothetical protein